jgi:hypothetical protein
LCECGFRGDTAKLLKRNGKTEKNPTGMSYKDAYTMFRKGMSKGNKPSKGFVLVNNPSSQSTVTLQTMVDSVVTHGDIKQILYTGGYNLNLICTAATDVMEAMCAVTFPWKWNMYQLPQFYTSSWQQDYALVWGPTDPAVLQGIYDAGDSVTDLAWLCDGMAIQINNSSTPKPWSWVEVGQTTGTLDGLSALEQFLLVPAIFRQLRAEQRAVLRHVGSRADWHQHSGQQPSAESDALLTYQWWSELAAFESDPANSGCERKLIWCARPLARLEPRLPAAEANAAPGTVVEDGSVRWTVVDPYGYGIRIRPIPSQTGPVWQFNFSAQKKPVRFSPKLALSAQTLFPLTDDYENTFRAGFVAQCYMNSPEEKLIKKGEGQWARWTQSVQSLSLQAAKQKGDRERDEDKFIAESTILGAGSPRVGWVGPGYPYGPIIG